MVAVYETHFSPFYLKILSSESLYALDSADFEGIFTFLLRKAKRFENSSV